MKQQGQATQQEKRQAELQLADAVAANQHACAWIHKMQDAPVYYPTAEQFADPIGYIHSIQGEAASYGICRIVPPCLPVMSGAKALLRLPGGGGRFSFTARSQQLGRVQWTSFGSGRFMQNSKKYTVEEFERFANAFARKQFGTTAMMPPRMVEAEYWRHQSTPAAAASIGSGALAATAAASPPAAAAASSPRGVASPAAAAAAAAGPPGAGDWIVYGNDVDGSAFSEHAADPLGSSKWNLKVLPRLPGSLLGHLSSEVPGITSPMLYIGMLFSSFAWHVEDHYLYSINYHHAGAPKTWYGVPASDADGFEDAVLQEVYGAASAAAAAQGEAPDVVRDRGLDALLDKTTVLNPDVLMRRGVKVFRAVQQPGEFIVTFPRAYHGGFSNGFNFGEAVNFATADWFPLGAQCNLRYARLGRPRILLQEALLLLEVEDVMKRLGEEPKDQTQQLRQLLALAGSASPPPAPQPSTSTAAAAAGDASNKAAELPAGYPLATTLRCFVRLLRWQHAARLALIRQLTAANASCCCQLMPAGMSSRTLTCRACGDTPALAVVLPPAGAAGTAEWAAAVAARRAAGSSDGTRNNANNNNTSSSSTPAGRLCGGTPSDACPAASAAAGASSLKRRNSPAGSKAAAAANDYAAELPFSNGVADEQAAADFTEATTPSCKRRKLCNDSPDSTEAAAAAADADAAAVDLADASAGDDSSSGSKDRQEKQQAAASGRAAAAAGPLCLMCGLHAAALAGQQQLGSWEGCVVMVAPNMVELEALARCLEIELQQGGVKSAAVECCLGDEGLTEALRYPPSSSTAAAAAAAADLSWLPASQDLQQRFAWQPDAPGMACMHAKQLAARKAAQQQQAAAAAAKSSEQQQQQQQDVAAQERCSAMEQQQQEPDQVPAVEQQQQRVVLDLGKEAGQQQQQQQAPVAAAVGNMGAPCAGSSAGFVQSTAAAQEDAPTATAGVAPAARAAPAPTARGGGVGNAAAHAAAPAPRFVDPAELAARQAAAAAAAAALRSFEQDGPPDGLLLGGLGLTPAQLKIAAAAAAAASASSGGAAAAAAVASAAHAAVQQANAVVLSNAAAAAGLVVQQSDAATAAAACIAANGLAAGGVNTGSPCSGTTAGSAATAVCTHVRTEGMAAAGIAGKDAPPAAAAAAGCRQDALPAAATAAAAQPAAVAAAGGMHVGNGQQHQAAAVKQEQLSQNLTHNQAKQQQLLMELQQLLHREVLVADQQQQPALPQQQQQSTAGKVAVDDLSEFDADIILQQLLQQQPAAAAANAPSSSTVPHSINSMGTHTLPWQQQQPGAAATAAAGDDEFSKEEEAEFMNLLSAAVGPQLQQQQQQAPAAAAAWNMKGSSTVTQQQQQQQWNSQQAEECGSQSIPAAAARLLQERAVRQQQQLTQQQLMQEAMPASREGNLANAAAAWGSTHQFPLQQQQQQHATSNALAMHGSNLLPPAAAAPWQQQQQQPSTSGNSGSLARQAGPNLVNCSSSQTASGGSPAQQPNLQHMGSLVNGTVTPGMQGLMQGLQQGLQQGFRGTPELGLNPGWAGSSPFLQGTNSSTRAGALAHSTLQQQHLLQQHMPAQLEQRIKAQQLNLQSNFQSNLLQQMHMGALQSNLPQQGSWTDEQLMLAQLLQGGQQPLDLLQEQQQQQQGLATQQRQRCGSRQR